MLYVRLSGEDLAKTTIRARPARMVELAGAAQRMRHPDTSAHLVAWRAATQAALRPVMRPYLDLIAPASPYYVPDFVVDTGDTSSLDEALSVIAEVPLERVRAETVPAIEAGRLPERLRPLTDGDPTARADLLRAIRAFHRVAVAPYVDQIEAAFRADRAARGQQVLTGGIADVLGSLSTQLRWDSATLSFGCAEGDDLVFQAGGRGVQLIPSYLVPLATLMNPPDSPKMAIGYPIEPVEPPLAYGRPLDALIGRTRAAVLAATSSGRTTSQLAVHVGISNATASHHASVLRSAGLLSTRRIGPAVLHTLTTLGERLLIGAHSRRDS